MSFPAFTGYDENQVSTGWLTYTAAGNTLVAGQGYAANLGTSNAPVTVNVIGNGKQRNRCFKPLQS